MSATTPRLLAVLLLLGAATACDETSNAGGDDGTPDAGEGTNDAATSEGDGEVEAEAAVEDFLENALPQGEFLVGVSVSSLGGLILPVHWSITGSSVGSAG